MKSWASFQKATHAALRQPHPHLCRARIDILPPRTICRQSACPKFPTQALVKRLGRSSRRHYSDQRPPYNPTPHLNSPTPSLSLSQRLRKLSREYGWSAFGVYMLLSALDFPFCFAAVRFLGADRIGRYEHVVLERIASIIPEQVKEAWWELRRRGGLDGKSGGDGQQVEGVAAVIDHGVDGAIGVKEEKHPIIGDDVGVLGYDHGVKDAEERNQSENASIWTQLALSYAIHKSFIFVRVPVTVAITPKVVKVLRGWGWNIGKRKPKP